MDGHEPRQAQLPQGNVGIWGGISENFEFHSSPESFIASRIQRWQHENPEATENRTAVRARILNRNVAIVSSYKHVRALLEDNQADGEQSPRCSAYPAYKDLMEPFFPPPNLLLADGCPHADMRLKWNGRMQKSQPDLQEHARVIIDDFLTETSLDTEVDLYEHLKTLAWRILLGCFLDVQPNNPLFDQLQCLQEDLLRGQFSLFPTSINIGFWQSPRNRGINARKSLQSLITKQLGDSKLNRSNIPFQSAGDHEVQQVVDHVLMMTSSLAVKALASLLTAYVLNLFCFNAGGGPLYLEVAQTQVANEKRVLLRSMYMETERLSPPIAGVMRRLNQDIVLGGVGHDADILLPCNWDVWFYFIGASRDPATFGKNSESFDPYRYMQESIPEPLGFGLGPKACLGRQLMQDINLVFAEHLLMKGIVVQGEVLEPGVKAWLGWINTTPEIWAADMKQLPTQHPKRPVIVKFVDS